MNLEKQKNDDTSNVESLKRNIRFCFIGLIIVFCLMTSGLVSQSIQETEKLVKFVQNRRLH